MTLLSRLSRSTGAYVSYPFVGAARAARYFGRVPYVPVDVESFTRSVFEAPQPFARGRPFGLPRNARWDAQQPFPTTQNRIAVIRGGSADGSGYVFDTSVRPVHGACHPRKQMLKYRWRTRRDGVAAPYMHDGAVPRHFDGRLGIVTATNQDCYYHWLFDILPRVRLALEQGVDRLYVQCRQPFQRSTLAILGIDDRLLVNTEDEPWVTADELVVPCHQIMTGHHHPAWVIDHLRASFLPAGPDSNTAGAKRGRRRIFVSRSVARNRHVLNEDAIYAILERRGFEYVLAEKLPFVVQVDMFADAEAVVAPHGAGLANLVFCPQGARVIELFPSLTMDSYHRLSIDTGLEYAFVKTGKFRLHRRVGENFTIDPADLTTVLDHFGL